MIERDEEDLSNGLELLFESVLKGKHTISLGEVIEVSDNGKTCKIQPALMRVREGQDEPERLPEIHDVPRGVSSGGPWIISYRLYPKDVVVLFVCERSIATWLTSGGVVDPQENDYWDINDAIVGPRVFSDKDDAGQNFDGVTIRKIDGSVSVDVASDKVVTQVGGQSLTVTAEKVKSTVLVDGADFTAYQDTPKPVVPPDLPAPGYVDFLDHTHMVPVTVINTPVMSMGPATTRPGPPEGSEE